MTATTYDRDRIRRQRESLLLTQEQLARRAGLSVKTVFNIERADYSPRADTRKRILEALDIPYEDHYKIFGPLPRR